VSQINFDGLITEIQGILGHLSAKYGFVWAYGDLTYEHRKAKITLNFTANPLVDDKNRVYEIYAQHASLEELQPVFSHSDAVNVVYQVKFPAKPWWKRFFPSKF
jgi:hypothetical protein